MSFDSALRDGTTLWQMPRRSSSGMTMEATISAPSTAELTWYLRHKGLGGSLRVCA